MNESEKMAIAARLHVLLRRQSGRVTDVEWMVANTEYAKAVVQLALQQAHASQDEDLQAVALRMQACLPAEGPAVMVPVTEPAPRFAAPAPAAPAPAAPVGPRYIGGLR